MNVLKLENRWSMLSAKELVLSIHPIARDPASLPHVLHIPMERIAAVSARDEKYMIGTTNLYSCLGLALYDAASQVGAMAHVGFDYKTYQKNSEFKLFGKVPQQIDGLFDAAEKKGGSNFDAFVVNLPSVWRSLVHDQELQTIVWDAFTKRSTPIRASYIGKDPMEFKLDSKTGLITPYWQ